MLKLQLALDFLNLKDALSVADKARNWVDWMEAGTPLIKAEGLKSIKVLRKLYPDKKIVADMKTADVGFLEAEMAFKAGADVVSVMGAAVDKTISSAVEAAKKHNKEIAVDLIGVEDVVRRAKEIEKLGADWLVLHTGIDEQNIGKDPFDKLEKIYTLGLAMKIALVGGLNKDSIKRLEGYPKVGLVIVGGAITGSESPETAAKTIKGVINEISQRNNA